MTSTMDQSPRGLRISSSILRYPGIALLAAATVTAQSKIIRPSGQRNSNSGKRTHVATLRSSDSSEGSRVAISSDQSLNDYEAYRRGDRFYIKIPAADVPRAESLRGRGYADVKSQRTGDSTVLSFRLQPGATAHVEQRGNKLDVVVAVPGGTPSVASNRPRELTRLNNVEPARNASANNRSAPSSKGNKNTSPRDNSTAKASPKNPNARLKSENPTLSTGLTPIATPTPAPTPSPKASPAATVSPTPAQKSSAVTNSASPSPSTVAAVPREDFWTRMKEHGHYWLLLAQLNPIPVAAGTLVLLFIIAALLMQRRRAKSTRRVRSLSSSKTATSAAGGETGPTKDVSLPLEAATAAGAATVGASGLKDNEDKPGPAPIELPTAPVAPASDDARHKRINQVADEAKKLLSGGSYDESLIGSDDRETRRLAGAELLSALVGRNPERRERARAAFVKHGYFDDATRDLRVAESDNERAAAARRLSFVHDPEAAPHLIGALGDSSPDVRRAAVEALMDLRDPSAIGPLNTLLQSETDRKVPRTLIKHAIDACATRSEQTAIPAPEPSSASLPPTTPQSLETDREVIEI
ncbi:MAG: HEAT repeat domain-containing protein [Pyrinomonadaceae bacterium]